MVKNTPKSLETTLAAGGHLAEGQFLHEEQGLNSVKSLVYRAGTRRPRAVFETRVNLSRKESVEAMSPHTQCVQF
jgi:hypothetical protein